MMAPFDHPAVDDALFVLGNAINASDLAPDAIMLALAFMTVVASEARKRDPNVMVAMAHRYVAEAYPEVLNGSKEIH